MGVDDKVVYCGMCGTVYPFGYEHRCGGGEVVVSPPASEEVRDLAEWIARRHGVGMMEFDSGEQKRRLARSVLRLANRLEPTDA